MGERAKVDEPAVSQAALEFMLAFLTGLRSIVIRPLDPELDLAKGGFSITLPLRDDA